MATRRLERIRIRLPLRGIYFDADPFDPSKAAEIAARIVSEANG